MTAVRVMVFGKLHRLEDRDAFEAMIPTISRKIKHATGYIRDELLRDAGEPGAYIMMSEWASREDFLAWVQSSVHPQNTSPLRAYWKADEVFKIYDLVAS
ncbi:MAG TPA: antibiotic biosynthesis monooxygenase family protein [Ktedonosporobacter sp.]|jgi:heme-degrading monooxygenase HmoA|nr:antibiotic biosynthesis monooxygenase family protein [Ktedonosporobacter sp.]